MTNTLGAPESVTRSNLALTPTQSGTSGYTRTFTAGGVVPPIPPVVGAPTTPRSSSSTPKPPGSTRPGRSGKSR